MLTRLKFRRDYRTICRFFSEKSDGDDLSQKNKDQKISHNDKEPSTAKIEGQSTVSSDNAKRKEASQSATDKINFLLKSMTEPPKISEKEYRSKFTTAPDRKKKDDIIESHVEKIDENLTKAAGEVAKALGGDEKQTETEILSKVLGKINQTSTSLSDLLLGMKVDRSSHASDDEIASLTRTQQVKNITARSQQRQQPMNKRRDVRILPTKKGPIQKVNIFSGEPLGIFKPDQPKNYGTNLETFEDLKQRELVMATIHPPKNYFEKMILWTEQGKVWKFPIDNEQGMEDENNVHFSEHIFLDGHLEGWCPKKGPVRHFMELVCVGLSKNAFYTVQEKIDHIMWYKEYFENKKELLSEVGAWNVSQAEKKAEV